MKEYFQNIATQLGLDFSYAPNSYQNLNSFDTDNPISKFMLFPMRTRRGIVSNSSYESFKTYSSSFMVLEKDVFDNSYEEMFDTPITNAYAIISAVVAYFECDNSKVIQNWDIEEVYNLFDMNATGLLVTFTIQDYD